MKKIFFSRIFILIVILLIFFSAYKFYNNYRKISQLRERLGQLEKDIASAKEKTNKLKLELKHINDLEYIEKIARKELGLVKPGELLIIPVEEETEMKK